MSDASEDPRSFSRRAFLKGSAIAAVANSLAERAAAAPPGAAPTTLRRGLGPQPLVLDVNGREHSLACENRTTLLDALREHADLTGTKKICDRGACGGCTVLVDGIAVNSCLMLAADAAGTKITTVEGLAKEGALHPVQQAFVDCDALQCGFCTPGFVMAGVACLGKHSAPSLDTIRHEVAGNICRCGTHGRVYEAIQKAGNGKKGAVR